MNIFIVPPNDLITYDIPNRLYHLACQWQYRHNIYLLRYPNYPMSLNTERPLRHVPVIPKAKRVKSLGVYQIRNAKVIHDAIKQTLRKEPIDVVIHANILPSFFATRIAKKYNTNNVFDYLDDFASCAANYYESRLQRTLVYHTVKFITKHNLKNSDKIVTISNAMRQMLQKYTKKSIHVIPNGVNLQLFRPMSKEYARKELALEERHPVLLFYGSITEFVDYNVLLHVTAHLKKKYPKVILLLVGRVYKRCEELEIKQKIRQLRIEENTVIESIQPLEKVPLYIAASDIVIAPFKDLPMNLISPLKIPETLACERPIIVTDIPEFKYWFKNFVKYYQTQDQLIKMIISILDNYDRIEKCLKSARAYIEANFSWSELAKKYEKILTSSIF